MLSCYKCKHIHVIDLIQVSLIKVETSRVIHWQHKTPQGRQTMEKAPLVGMKPVTVSDFSNKKNVNGLDSFHRISQEPIAKLYYYYDKSKEPSIT